MMARCAVALCLLALLGGSAHAKTCVQSNCVKQGMPNDFTVIADPKQACDYDQARAAKLPPRRWRDRRRHLRQAGILRLRTDLLSPCLLPVSLSQNICCKACEDYRRCFLVFLAAALRAALLPCAARWPPATACCRPHRHNLCPSSRLPAAMWMPSTRRATPTRTSLSSAAPAGEWGAPGAADAMRCPAAAAPLPLRLPRARHCSLPPWLPCAAAA